MLTKPNATQITMIRTEPRSPGEVGLVALRRVAPRAAAQKLSANGASGTSHSAAERGGAVAARQPLPHIGEDAVLITRSLIAALRWLTAFDWYQPAHRAERQARLARTKETRAGCHGSRA